MVCEWCGYGLQPGQAIHADCARKRIDDLERLILSFKRADIEFRRAISAGTQPRLSRAGTRCELAKLRLVAEVGVSRRMLKAMKS